MTSSIVPISLDRHGQKWFRRFTSYGFASSDTVTPLVGAELAKACVSFPIAFAKQGEDTALVAVLGTEPGANLFVGPDGRWIGPYVPALLRAYPFTLARTTDNRQVLCIDEASGLVVDKDGSERFFDDDGQPTASMRAIADFLMKVHENRVLTEQACRAIADAELLEPWTFTIASDSGPRNITGLWRVSEERMAKLEDEPFLNLRRAGALPIIYGQLMAMGHVPLLERLTQLRAQIQQKSAAPLPASLDTIFDGAGTSDEIQIDWSQFKS